MNVMNRIRIIGVSTNVKMLLIMGLAYGVVFGGISQGFLLAAGETTVAKFVVSILMYGAMYECMFLFVILIVIIAVNTKGYISLGMERLTVYKIWRDLLIFITSFMIIVFNVIVWFNIGDDEIFLKGRAFNINFNGLEVTDYLKIFGIIALVACLMNVSVSLIANIGNRYGIINCFAALGVFLGIVIMCIPKLIRLVMWGDGFSMFCIILAVLNCILFMGSKKLIMNTEVGR